MIKKLKIRFVKFEKALAMQILEQAGAFNDSEHVKFKTFPLIDSDYVCLRGCAKEVNFAIAVERFNSNDERDANSHNYACYQEAKAEIDEKNAHISYLEDMLRQIANIVGVYQGHKRAESIALKHEEDKTEPLSRIEECPICGKTVLDFTERFADREFGSFFIKCELCGATTNEYDTPEAALKAWNTGDVYDPNKVIER